MKLFSVRKEPLFIDLILLLVRLGFGYVFIVHGWGKIQHPFNWMGEISPVPGFMQGLASLAEFGGGIAMVLGLVTRLAAAGLICTMAVATYAHLGVFGDPLVSSTGGHSAELAMSYLLLSFLLLVFGPGRFSLDRKLF